MNTPDYKVSIIVPIYNVEKYLPNCLNHILNQSYTNWEAILINDGSPDNCDKIIDEYVQLDKRFIVLNQENGGLSAARNNGLALASGDYIVFLDSDDFLHQDYLKKMIDLSLQHNADIVQCRYVYGTKTEFPSVLQNIQPEIKVYNNHNIFTSYAAKVTVWAKLYRKEIISDLRFREGYVNEDDFYTWKAFYNAGVIVTTSESLYYYTKNRTSIMSNLQKKPDTRFISAYEERIVYFADRGEWDLVHNSRVQLMKALILLTSSPALTKDEKKEIIALWTKHKLQLQRGNYALPLKLQMPFILFPWFPKSVSKLSNYFYTAKEE